MPTIRETAEEYLGNEIDIDVCDTDIDMCVCLCHTLGDTSDAMEKFIELLCNNVIVTRFDPENGHMVCDFSGFYRIYREKINKWIDEVGLIRCGDFDDDEPEYELTNITEQLISGNAGENLYASLLKVFT